MHQIKNRYREEAEERINGNSNLAIEETSVTVETVEVVTVTVIEESSEACAQDWCKGPPEMDGPFVADVNVLGQLVYEGKKVGDGDCVDLLQKVMSIPNTEHWVPGERVEDTAGSSSIQPGTAIATFINRKYPNKKSGNGSD